MTEEQIAEHNRAFQDAAAIIKGEIPLHESPDLPAPGWWLRRKLKRALSLFDRVLELNPENWSAMWLMGKVHQRCQDQAEALSWFERAYQVNPSQPDVAREASMCAMDLGRHDAAITFAYRAVQVEPANPGLHANLALAYLLGGRIPDAQAAIDRAVAADPTDTISQTIQAITRHFAANGRTPPTTTPALLGYWTKQRNT
ncbi:MAG TPA: tetratricopeptide repeat protein [Chthoniobacter sp.]|nr:tetratricopeptide repeat protein [Chthoniobacter sp.]